MSKITLVAAFGAGYVLGARAGRGRYREIRDKATSFWQSKQSQNRATTVQDVAENHAAKARTVDQDRLPNALGGTGARDTAPAVDTTAARTQDTGHDAQQRTHSTPRGLGEVDAHKVLP